MAHNNKSGKPKKTHNNATQKRGGKRKLSAWNLFVKKVHKENPGKSFKEVLKMASTLKKKGAMGKKH